MRACLAVLLLAGVQDADRPNVVFLLADDLGYADLRCTGHPYARTPNLDRLARDGTRFDRFYVTGVTCCPSRTGFMTSRFPARFATYPAAGGFGDVPTVTGVLKKAGYATGHFGKWHIGPSTAPGTYGIDVIDAAGGDRREARGRDATIYDAATRFIEANKDRPFYVNVWGHIAHNPVDPPDALVEPFKDIVLNEAEFPPAMREKFAHVRAKGGDPQAAIRKYLADVHSLDQAVGRLLDRLDALGLREKTVVVFSSDHGASGPRDEERSFTLMGFNGLFRGGKHGMYEGGVRVPFIVRWPGRVPAGRVDRTSVLSGIDWLPTVCALAGAPVDAAAFDGEDVSKAWLGGEHVRSKPLFWKVSNPRADVGIRDGRWKLHLPMGKRGEPELYDLEADPVEARNVADAKPDVLRALRARAEAWNATLPAEYVKADDKDD